jgi:hypothetical protein
VPTEFSYPGTSLGATLSEIFGDICMTSSEDAMELDEGGHRAGRKVTMGQDPFQVSLESSQSSSPSLPLGSAAAPLPETVAQACEQEEESAEVHVEMLLTVRHNRGDGGMRWSRSANTSQPGDEGSAMVVEEEHVTAAQEGIGSQVRHREASVVGDNNATLIGTTIAPQTKRWWWRMGLRGYRGCGPGSPNRCQPV